MVKKENRLFAGIWYGSSKPDMSLLLKPLAETLVKLYKDGTCLFHNHFLDTDSTGVKVTLPEGDEVITRAVLLCCTCDMPAKA